MKWIFRLILVMGIFASGFHIARTHDSEITQIVNRVSTYVNNKSSIVDAKMGFAKKMVELADESTETLKEDFSLNR